MYSHPTPMPYIIQKGRCLQRGRYLIIPAALYSNRAANHSLPKIYDKVVAKLLEAMVSYSVTFTVKTSDTWHWIKCVCTTYTEEKTNVVFSAV